MKLGVDNCHAWKKAGRGRLSQAGVAGKSKGRIRLFGRVARYLKYAVETGGGLRGVRGVVRASGGGPIRRVYGGECRELDRKSTRLNSSHLGISYAVFC